MKQWIKDNLVLVAGIILPVLLVAGFFILGKAPRVLTDPPEYDFLVVAYRYDYQHPRDFHLTFEVRDGALLGKVTPTDDDPNHGHGHLNRQYASIFRYRSDGNRFDEIVYDLPDGLEDLDEPLEFAVWETRLLELDRRSVSPDGFKVEYQGYRGRGGLLGEIFGMGSRRDSEYVLSKDGADFNLPRVSSHQYYYQHDLHFKGWIVAEGGSR